MTFGFITFGIQLPSINDLPINDVSTIDGNLCYMTSQNAQITIPNPTVSINSNNIPTGNIGNVIFAPFYALRGYFTFNFPVNQITSSQLSGLLSNVYYTFSPISFYMDVSSDNPYFSVTYNSSSSSPSYSQTFDFISTRSASTYTQPFTTLQPFPYNYAGSTGIWVNPITNQYLTGYSLLTPNYLNYFTVTTYNSNSSDKWQLKQFNGQTGSKFECNFSPFNFASACDCVNKDTEYITPGRYGGPSGYAPNERPDQTGLFWQVRTSVGPSGMDYMQTVCGTSGCTGKPIPGTSTIQINTPILLKSTPTGGNNTYNSFFVDTSMLGLNYWNAQPGLIQFSSFDNVQPICGKDVCNNTASIINGETHRIYCAPQFRTLQNTETQLSSAYTIYQQISNPQYIGLINKSRNVQNSIVATRITGTSGKVQYLKYTLGYNANTAFTPSGTPFLSPVKRSVLTTPNLPDKLSGYASNIFVGGFNAGFFPNNPNPQTSTASYLLSMQYLYSIVIPSPTSPNIDSCSTICSSSCNVNFTYQYTSGNNTGLLTISSICENSGVTGLTGSASTSISNIPLAIYFQSTTPPPNLFLLQLQNPNYDLVYNTGTYNNIDIYFQMWYTNGPTGSSNLFPGQKIEENLVFGYGWNVPTGSTGTSLWQIGGTGTIYNPNQSGGYFPLNGTGTTGVTGTTEFIGVNFDWQWYYNGSSYVLNFLSGNLQDLISVQINGQLQSSTVTTTPILVVNSTESAFVQSFVLNYSLYTDLGSLLYTFSPQSVDALESLSTSYFIFNPASTSNGIFPLNNGPIVTTTGSTTCAITDCTNSIIWGWYYNGIYNLQFTSIGNVDPTMIYINLGEENSSTTKITLAFINNLSNGGNMQSFISIIRLYNMDTGSFIGQFPPVQVQALFYFDYQNVTLDLADATGPYQNLNSQQQFNFNTFYNATSVGGSGISNLTFDGITFQTDFGVGSPGYTALNNCTFQNCTFDAASPSLILFQNGCTIDSGCVFTNTPFFNLNSNYNGGTNGVANVADMSGITVPGNPVYVIITSGNNNTETISTAGGANSPLFQNIGDNGLYSINNVWILNTNSISGSSGIGEWTCDNAYFQGTSQYGSSPDAQLQMGYGGTNCIGLVDASYYWTLGGYTGSSYIDLSNGYVVNGITTSSGANITMTFNDNQGGYDGSYLSNLTCSGYNGPTFDTQYIQWSLTTVTICYATITLSSGYNLQPDPGNDGITPCIDGNIAQWILIFNSFLPDPQFYSTTNNPNKYGTVLIMATAGGFVGDIIAWPNVGSTRVDMSNVNVAVPTPQLPPTGTNKYWWNIIPVPGTDNPNPSSNVIQYNQTYTVYIQVNALAANASNYYLNASSASNSPVTVTEATCRWSLQIKPYYSG